MKKYEDLKVKAYENISKYKDIAIELNDYLADNPEVSGEEFKSSKKIVDLLREHGYQVEYPFAGYETAFRAKLGNKTYKRNIAILTEYDALPEIGHACGHCTSAAISILTALAVKDMQEELDANIEIIGTPVEETDGAKCTMAKNGVFDKYDMALMVHLYGENLISPNLLALDSFMYTFHGKSAHASADPWEGINALNAVQLMFHAIDMLRQHVKPDVRMHGVIKNGGLAPNIVPEIASAEFYIRSLDRNYLNELGKKVDDCAKGAAIATGTTFEKTPTAESYDNLKPNKIGLLALAETYEELGLEIGDTEKVFGSSDAGNVSMVCPAFHPLLQIVDASVALHTREFEKGVRSQRAYEGIETGAKILSLQILKIFTDEEKFQAMKQDFLKN